MKIIMINLPWVVVGRLVVDYNSIKNVNNFNFIDISQLFLK